MAPKEWLYKTIQKKETASSLSTSLTALDGGNNQLQSKFTVTETVDGRTVARLDQSVAGNLQSIMHEIHHRCGGYTVHPTREAAIAEANNPNCDHGVPSAQTRLDQTTHPKGELPSESSGI